MVLSRDKRKPKLLDEVRFTLQAKHYSLRTKEAYVNWIKRFIFFHGKQHPLELSEKQINRFLTYLAVQALGLENRIVCENHTGVRSKERVIKKPPYPHGLLRFA